MKAEETDSLKSESNPNAPVVVERIVRATPKRVWDAITKKDLMKQWYFDLSDFKAEVGFQFSFPGEGHKGAKYTHLCEVTEVIPTRKLAYTWRYEGLEGTSIVSFELEKAESGTKVILTHSGLDSFPAGNPDFSRSSFNGGWTELIGKLLPAFVER